MTRTIAQSQKLTFEEYLSYDDGTDNRYELIDGELVALPPESGRNDFIAFYLRDELIVLVERKRVRLHSCAIQVPVLKPGQAQNRYPDLVILRPEHLDLTQQQLAIKSNMPPPVLVVEVVSPGRVSWNRDYLEKREQYAARGIPEYWIVDPQAEVVIVLQLKSSTYVEVGQFRGTQRIVSPSFPALNLSAEQILKAE